MIEYEIIRKRIKNVNLHIKDDGSVYVTAPRHVSKKFIDDFVESKADWIERERGNATNRALTDSGRTDEECLALFNEISDRIYPHFAKSIGKKPLLKVRFMKSCWGVCHYRKGYITLNRALADKPYQAVEYVVLHEYVHFIVHDHQQGFYNMMRRFMPDYKERAKLLKQ